jgi:hypothetical protein
MKWESRNQTAKAGAEASPADLPLDYLKLVEETDNFQKCSFDRITFNLVPDANGEEHSEYQTIKTIVQCLKKFDELCVWLQKDDPSDVKMSKVRFYFDKLLVEFPNLRRYLGKDSNLK